MKPRSVALVTGCFATAYTLDVRLYPTLAKQYYALRHGYTFVHQVSNQFDSYFAYNTWEVRDGRSVTRGSA